MKSLIYWVIGTVAIGTSLFTQAQTPVVTGKELKIGLVQDFDTLNQVITGMLASTYVYNMVGRKLVTLDEHMKWQPQLAEKIPSLKDGSAKEITENGQKKIVATWNIKKNAVWGDGKEVTCFDLQFSKELGSNQNIAATNRDAYNQIEKIECSEQMPKSAKITYKTNRWDFYKMYQFFIMPAHIEKPIYDQFKDQKEGYEKNSAYVKDPTNVGLYNGPYVVSEFKSSSHIIVTRNLKFYGSPSKIEKIIIKIIPNTSAIEANLYSGEIDMISCIGFNFDQGQMIEKKSKADKLGYTVYYQPALTYEHIDYNLENPILKDENVRKAIKQSIDRDLMVQSLFEGKQPVASHFISPRDPWFKKLATKSSTGSYSKNKAEILFDKAGWIRNEKDGYRYKDGQKFSVVFSTTAGNKLRETVAVYLQDQLKKVGVDLVIKNLPARVFFGDLMKNRKFEGMAMYAWSFIPENPPTVFYHSRNVPSENNGYSGRNYPGWKNEVVDASTIALETANQPKRQIRLISKIVDEYTNQQPTLPLYYRADVSVAPANLKGYLPTGHQQLETNFVENWHF